MEYVADAPRFPLFTPLGGDIFTIKILGDGTEAAASLMAEGEDIFDDGGSISVDGYSRLQATIAEGHTPSHIAVDFPSLFVAGLGAFHNGVALQLSQGGKDSQHKGTCRG
jgi:glyoxylase-like metal-dependent hydrolase (beta-lactamase superfamily II)